MLATWADIFAGHRQPALQREFESHQSAHPSFPQEAYPVSACGGRESRGEGTENVARGLVPRWGGDWAWQNPPRELAAQNRDSVFSCLGVPAQVGMGDLYETRLRATSPARSVAVSKEGRTTVMDKPAQPDERPPIINIAGEKVALGPLRKDLSPLHNAWSNDFEVQRFFENMRPMTSEAQEKWYARASKKETEATFTVYERKRFRPIGIAGLSGIDQANRNAEFFIMIGEKESWGQGYGTEVARLVLDYGFTCLSLHNIWLWVSSANERGLRAYRRAGFRMAGRLRQSSRVAGRACDDVLMDCLANEFEGGALSHLLPEPSEVTE